MSATQRLLLQGGAMDQQQFINFVRQRGLAVIATRAADGAPQAALVGITTTGRGELVFDTSRRSRKCRNLSAFCSGSTGHRLGQRDDRAARGDRRHSDGQPTTIAVCRRTLPSIRTAWSAPMIPTSCTSASAQTGCGTATTGLGPSSSRRSLWAADPRRSSDRGFRKRFPI
jgi:Pyridoxamine 5'-phosphate oxidase